MALQHASRLLLACAWLSLATLIGATVPPHIHEARQGPNSIVPLSTDPGPVSIHPSSSTTPNATTMSPTSSSKPTLLPSLSPSPLPLTTSSNTPLYSSSSSGTPESPPTSSATPQPSSSPTSLTFTVQNLTTCTSAVVSWKYSGTESQLSLSVTNIGVPQYDDALPRIKNVVNAEIQQQLADTNTSATPWPWQTVNLTQGWYEIQGLVLTKPTVNVFSSSPFFVSDGPDVSCLTGTSPQSSSTVSPGATFVPQPSRKATVNVGGIAGGVIGGIAVLVLAILAGVCLSRRRRKATPRRRLSKPRQYGSLKSTTSSIQPGDGGPQFPGNHSHSHSDSTGAILQDVAGGRVSATTTPGGSDEHGTVVDEEKLASPASYPGMSPFDALNTPLHHDRRASTYSIQIPIAVASENFRSRVPSTHTSTHTSTQTLEQQAQRIRCSMETSNRHRSERLSMPTQPSPALAHSPTHAQPKEEYPLTPMTPTPVNRSISAGAVSTIARRTSRKPVPQYDPSKLLEDKNADSVSTHTAGAESSQSHGTGLGTGVHGTPPDLVHKASFGDGRPMHYLMPDMPSPQLD
ncbi:hypothetical protein EV363DRAFT_1274582 [Boletus edulis]|uniref:Uncharacterized protein n=1 Tax=Boletus edulis BED1 TaxID=1328754 RepID=A0AAD4BH85_BOLED|nr:hypothetical protein EV363DRAFT_1281584 [Boletus edulis]KAF8122615.1 hypothetical protein EV363DRAFT_1274582 [Boletus edulis]KAF8430864.1 hypothetical protein L210DRAFT_3764413 [Boletus edulis BED1]